MIKRNESIIDFLHWLEESDYRYDDNFKLYRNKDGRLKTKQEILEIYDLSHTTN